MKLRNLLLAAILFAPLPAFAQPVIGRFFSLGLTGGGSLTDAMADHTVMGVDTDTRYFSQSKDYIIGPEVEVHLPLNLSVEFDALYRPLHLSITETVIPRSAFTLSSTVNSWEFPLLAKYRLRTPLVKPFVEAGPSFRTVRTFADVGPDFGRQGFTAGGGVEVKVFWLRIDPEIRYTRWVSDANPSPSSTNPQSNVNQAELLLGLTF